MLITVPSKQQVRDYLQSRVKAKTAPPDQDEIRRQLGFPFNGKPPYCPR